VTDQPERRYVQALALGLDPAWRRLHDSERCEDAAIFCEAVEHGAPGQRAGAVTTFTYSMIGLHPGAELLLWRLAPSLKDLEEAAAAALRSGLGRHLRVTESLLGIIQPSQYVRRPTEQEQSLFTGERSRYLVVYPFTKSADWYLLSQAARQGIMNEHIRVGHEYPQVRQLLAYSFGVDDQDFLVAYETDDLAAFGNLVRDLRGTESRRSTVRDTPILTCIHRPLTEILGLLGAPDEVFDFAGPPGR
jgi:chlorite dismutase